MGPPGLFVDYVPESLEDLEHKVVAFVPVRSPTRVGKL